MEAELPMDLPKPIEVSQKSNIVQESISYTRRLTLRNNAMLARGVHPATKLSLRKPEGETCGSCVHSVPHGHNRKRYWKCDLTEWTFGPATDIRISWAACEKWVRYNKDNNED